MFSRSRLNADSLIVVGHQHTAATIRSAAMINHRFLASRAVELLSRWSSSTRRPTVSTPVVAVDRLATMFVVGLGFFLQLHAGPESGMSAFPGVLDQGGLVEKYLLPNFWSGTPGCWFTSVRSPACGSDLSPLPAGWAASAIGFGPFPGTAVAVLVLMHR